MTDYSSVASSGAADVKRSALDNSCEWDLYGQQMDCIAR